ncbi:hypothetical protein HDV05_002873 [Chytridiales sp. JEL 0842]|nr:hypothetical protein HDV05_002873 [Chytridiales sp. JEL 0842]
MVTDSAKPPDSIQHSKATLETNIQTTSSGAADISYSSTGSPSKSSNVTSTLAQVDSATTTTSVVAESDSAPSSKQQLTPPATPVASAFITPTPTVSNSQNSSVPVSRGPLKWTAIRTSAYFVLQTNNATSPESSQTSKKTKVAYRIATNTFPAYQVTSTSDLELAQRIWSLLEQIDPSVGGGSSAPSSSSQQTFLSSTASEQKPSLTELIRLYGLARKTARRATLSSGNSSGYTQFWNSKAQKAQTRNGKRRGSSRRGLLKWPSPSAPTATVDTRQSEHDELLSDDPLYLEATDDSDGFHDEPFEQDDEDAESVQIIATDSSENPFSDSCDEVEDAEDELQESIEARTVNNTDTNFSVVTSEPQVKRSRGGSLLSNIRHQKSGSSTSVLSQAFHNLPISRSSTLSSLGLPKKTLSNGNSLMSKAKTRLRSGSANESIKRSNSDITPLLKRSNTIMSTKLSTAADRSAINAEKDSSGTFVGILPSDRRRKSLEVQDTGASNSLKSDAPPASPIESAVESSLPYTFDLDEWSQMFSFPILNELGILKGTQNQQPQQQLLGQGQTAGGASSTVVVARGPPGVSEFIAEIQTLLTLPEIEPGKKPTLQQIAEYNRVHQRRRTLVLFTLYAIIARLCSWDMFISLLLITNLVLLYGMKNAKKINVKEVIV